MSTLITALFALTFSIAFAFRNHFQFMERNWFEQPEYRSYVARMNRNWHLWQGVVQCSVIAAIFLYSFWQPVWIDTLLFWAIFWLVFEESLNLLNGNGILYLGGGFIDSAFDRWKYGAVVKLILQLLFIAATVLLYNFFP
jgi:hypothetical protein